MNNEKVFMVSIKYAQYDYFKLNMGVEKLCMNETEPTHILPPTLNFKFDPQSKQPPKNPTEYSRKIQ